ncbi:hypothetical protein BDR06DRAFT_439703 [Suillus hirtellus]|nr:hypothetical protein BDR06DRAFT_439703 [Suillus hirtellus]
MIRALDGSINTIAIRLPSSPLTYTLFFSNMTIVSNDPTWWPVINSNRISSYVAVASVIIVMYDWVLTFGQEVELVWRQRWSLMTVMYLGVRYLGILSAALTIPNELPTISLTDTVSFIMSGVISNWMGFLVFSMLWVIMITRLYAMYQRSRKILIFLIVTFLATNVFIGVVGVMSAMHTSGEENILSGTYQCSVGVVGQFTLLDSIAWILGTMWEVLVLCLSVWIVVKHFRELRQQSAGGIIIADCFAVLMKTHVLYFASFVAVSFLQLITQFSPTFLTDQYSLKAHVYFGLLQILEAVQSFVLGPRLILGVREYHAKLVANSDTATAMTSIAFQERVHISTDNGV